MKEVVIKNQTKFLHLVEKDKKLLKGFVKQKRGSA